MIKTKRQTFKIYTGRKHLTGALLFFIVLFSLPGFAQETRVNSEIDSARIKIGEQIIYSIEVETDSADLVVFPEGDSFSPMEVVESFNPDTTRLKERLRLLKEYSLTQFDSGKYVIPKQKIIISDREYFTDSLLVEVADVAVDTTRQKMYPIKPSVEVPGTFTIPAWVWWLAAILILAGLAFYFFRRKKKKEAEKELPPYEQVILELNKLDSSSLLEQREVKEYYSQLSFSARKYLDREIYDRALESTTSELIAYLELNKMAGKLKLDEKTIRNLKLILERADLAKFANSRPDVITAKTDRAKIEHVINDVKTAVPEPTEEELMRDKEWQKVKARKQKRKKIIIGAVILALIIGAGATALVATKGFTYVKDTVFGHPTKELLEGDWIRSEYGNPPVVITTPEVLTRTEPDMPEETREMMLGSETFTYGSLLSNFFTSVTTVKMSAQTEFDLEKSVDGVYSMLEEQGARNIIMKEEEFSTLSGAEGIRIFGTLEVESPVTGRMIQNEYEILNFAENNGFQQITVIYNEDDSYADEISERIINSVEFNNEQN